MWQAGIEPRRGILKQLRGKRPGICEGNDLVVLAVHHECGHIDLIQVLGEVGLGEGLDAVILGFDPPPSFPAATSCLSLPEKRSRPAGYSRRRGG